VPETLSPMPEDRGGRYFRCQIISGADPRPLQAAVVKSNGAIRVPERIAAQLALRHADRIVKPLHDMWRGARATLIFHAAVRHVSFPAIPLSPYLCSTLHPRNVMRRIVGTANVLMLAATGASRDAKQCMQLPGRKSKPRHGSYPIGPSI
jgi:hypothetical protein